MAGTSRWGTCWARNSLMILMVNEAKRHQGHPSENLC